VPHTVASFTGWASGAILRLFEIAPVLVRLDHVAGVSVNANHGVVWTAAKLIYLISEILGQTQPVKVYNFLAGLRYAH
jgi:hypothetical protein